MKNTEIVDGEPCEEIPGRDLVVDEQLELDVGAIVRIGSDDWPEAATERESHIWKAFVRTDSARPFVLATIVDACPVPRITCACAKRTNGYGVEIRLYFNEKVKRFLATIALVHAGAKGYAGPWPIFPP